MGHAGVAEDAEDVGIHTDVSKIDENRCKQTLSSLPCFWAYR